MDEKGMDKRLRTIEQEIKNIRKALNIIAEENDILKIDLANVTIEKMKIRKEREKFYKEQIKQMDEYDEKYSERLCASRKTLDEINEKYDKLYEENQILLFEKSETILEEMLKRASEIMEETGENPFDLK